MTVLPPPPLPSLDYAFLAEFASVQPNGTLTSVGASFTSMVVQSLPESRQLSIAGRIRVAADAGPVQVRITLTPPDHDEPVMGFDMVATTDGERPYQGRVGMLFAINTNIPLFAEGLHVFSISIDDELVRELAFSVEKAPS